MLPWSPTGGPPGCEVYDVLVLRRLPDAHLATRLTGINAGHWYEGIRKVACALCGPPGPLGCGCGSVNSKAWP